MQDLRIAIQEMFSHKGKILAKDAMDCLVEHVQGYGSVDELVERICAALPDVTVITLPNLMDVSDFVQILHNGRTSGAHASPAASNLQVVENVTPAAADETNHRISKSARKRERSQLKILRLYRDKGCKSEAEAFAEYFRSRYEKLSAVLRGRLSPQPISRLSGNGRGAEIVGIVSSVRETASGNAIIELEDPTGRISVIARDELKDQALELLGDEVIGVIGRLSGRFLIAERIFFPDVPVKTVESLKKCQTGIAFISDTHFGSDTFLDEAWNRFVTWLNCEGLAAELAEKVEYVFVAGDVVDGVGIFPGQENELRIHDIYQQYEAAAEQFDRLPKDVDIILAPGNHDAVRQAEPQPPLPKEFADLFPGNVRHVSNPAVVEVSGLKVMVYHGRTLDEIVARIHRLSYAEPAKLMVEYLKRRTLAPAYGSKSVHIAPLREDVLVIDEVPDVLHCGHVHTYGVGVYRGVLLVNSSTFQGQTAYQKKMNFNPQPGNVAVFVDGKVRRLRLGS